MRVAELIGRTLVDEGVQDVFGVVGSGNFRITSAMVNAGARYVAARHENGAACMADAFSKATGTVPAISVHQGPGLTNAITGIVEAAKSNSALLVLAPATPSSRQTSNFYLDQSTILRAAGCHVIDVGDGADAAASAREAVRFAVSQRTVVVLNMDTDVLDEPAPAPTASSGAASDRAGHVGGDAGRPENAPDPDDLRALVDVLARSHRPVFIVGRGGMAAAESIRALAERSGALLSTSAVARGLFAGDDWNLDTSGGFATPLAAELIRDADTIVAWGASLNRWTTRSGGLLARATTVVQVDDRPQAFELHSPVHLAVRGDTREVADGVLALWRTSDDAPRYRRTDVRERVADEGDWRLVPYDDTSTAEAIDPRKATIALDAVLPSDRIVVPDGGNFNAYPSMLFGIPDARAYSLPLAFQSIGLALASAIGAQLGTPERTAIAGIGDGGFLMSLVELETAVRLGIPLAVIVYNDHAYGAEVHHFADDADGAFEAIEFPPTDIAAIARGFGCEGVTMRSLDDLGPVEEWVRGPRNVPLVVDVKITSFPSWVLAHTFDSHE